MLHRTIEIEILLFCQTELVSFFIETAFSFFFSFFFDFVTWLL